MEFRSKVDKATIILYSIILFTFLIVFLTPIIFDNQFETIEVVISLAGCFFFTGPILWFIFSLKYVLNEDHLFIVGGPFRSRIPYENITGVSSTKEVFVGYKMCLSSDALEISYRNAVMGSVKISPKKKELFLSELGKHCTQINIGIISEN